MSNKRNLKKHGSIIRKVRQAGADIKERNKKDNERYKDNTSK